MREQRSHTHEFTGQRLTTLVFLHSAWSLDFETYNTHCRETAIEATRRTWPLLAQTTQIVTDTEEIDGYHPKFPHNYL
jgi:hypothetical protein